MKVIEKGLQLNDLNTGLKAKIVTRTSIVIRCNVLLLFIMGCMIFSPGFATAQDKPQVVRMARLQIDSTQLENYKAALKEEIETSINIEPGVLTLYAVAEKNKPTHITIFETYANTEAYQAHLQTPHFKKYKSTTKEMVKALELVEVAPIVLGAKKK